MRLACALLGVRLLGWEERLADRLGSLLDSLLGIPDNESNTSTAKEIEP